MKYIASFSCKVGNYTIQWRENFAFHKDAVDALKIERGGIERHFGVENVKEFTGMIEELTKMTTDK